VGVTRITIFFICVHLVHLRLAFSQIEATGKNGMHFPIAKPAGVS
jgi:hypothetical protein